MPYFDFEADNGNTYEIEYDLHETPEGVSGPDVEPVAVCLNPPQAAPGRCVGGEDVSWDDAETAALAHFKRQERFSRNGAFVDGDEPGLRGMRY